MPGKGAEAAPGSAGFAVVPGLPNPAAVSYTHLLGAVPLALGSGSGSELRRPLGITIIGGLLISQLLTLYTTPVIYIWFDRLASLISRRPRVGKVPDGAALAPVG